MENEVKKKNYWKLTTIILMILLILLIVLFIFNISSNKNSDNSNTKNSKMTNDTSDENDNDGNDQDDLSIRVSLDDENVVDLYNKFKGLGPTGAGTRPDLYSMAKTIKMKDLPMEDKLSIASLNMDKEQYNSSVPENELKAAYEMTFGSSSEYQRVKQVYLFSETCIPYVFNSTTNAYELDKSLDVCGGEVAGYLVENLIGAKENERELDLYIRAGWCLTDTSCEDFEGKKIKGDYIYNIDELSLYKFVFIEDDGQYIFDSIEYLK